MNTEIAEIINEPDNELPLAVSRRPAELPVQQVSKTSQDLRIVEVSTALEPAYAKASTLDLTDAEVDALTAHFTDDMVEIRPHDGLIYIPHIHISDRLNKVLRPGKWALVLRRHWMEGGTMYGEYVLLIRGCYIGESVGGHPYQPNNPKVNFSDTLESTAGEALRRIAGKRLSCGSQVWNPEYARQWVSKHAAKVNGRWERRINGPSSAPQATASAFKAQESPKAPAKPTEPPKPLSERIAGMVAKLGEVRARWAVGYFQNYTADGGVQSSALMPNEGLESLSEHSVTWLAANWGAFCTRLDEYIETNDAGDQLEGAEAPTAKAPPAAEKPPEGASVEGVIESVSVKEGKNARGPWTCYGLKIAGGWISSFSRSIGEAAQEIKGRSAVVYYTENAKGRTATAITHNGVTVRAGESEK